MSKDRTKSARRAINRLVVVCHDEVLALDWAARKLGGERGARLREQASRRTVFLGDLRSGVVALGGVPAGGASYRARASGAVRVLRELVTGLEQGDVYIFCARATQRTSDAYAEALDQDLPGDARFGVEQQKLEIEFDRKELRWLRWGGSLSDAPLPNEDWQRAPVSEAPADGRALEVWEQDGGSQAT
jgi:hypothetical protein